MIFVMRGWCRPTYERTPLEDNKYFVPFDVGFVDWDSFFGRTSIYLSVANIELAAVPGTLNGAADDGAAGKAAASVWAPVVEGYPFCFRSCQDYSFIS